MSIVKTIVSALIPASFKPFTMFPYRYCGKPYAVVLGREEGLPFGEYEGHRVYFPSEYGDARVACEYRTYLEDEGLTGKGRRTHSPHCYVTSAHRPEKGEIIVDVGCSEGFFSRAFAAEARKIYLFEADTKWAVPLRKTFADCWDRVVYTGKYVGSRSENAVVSLADIIQDGSDSNYFIKMDIEGAEREVLAAATDFLVTHKVKLSCCAYHRQDDGRFLTRFLKSLGFQTQYSEGWMLPYESRTFPFFRRGVIYARNY